MKVKWKDVMLGEKKFKKKGEKKSQEKNKHGENNLCTLSNQPCSLFLSYHT